MSLFFMRNPHSNMHYDELNYFKNTKDKINFNKICIAIKSCAL